METTETTPPAKTPAKAAFMGATPNLEVLYDVPVKVTAMLGGCELPMQEVLQLAVGSVVPLDKAANAPIDLYVNNKLFARGEVVVLDEHFAIRVTEILTKSS